MLHRDEYWAQAQTAAAALRERGCTAPVAAVQCGSGLAPLIAALWADGPEAAGGGRCAFSEVPHLASTGVAGHGTEVLWGHVPGPGGAPRQVLVYSGRLHLYEGHSPLRVSFPVAIASALGSRLFVVTNAAGALNRHFGVGEVMMQTDFINSQGDNPLLHLACPPPDPAAEPGSVESLTRFTDPKPAYDAVASETLAGALADAGLTVNHGVYVSVRGPLYETRAELCMYRSFGADAIGMSTVQELTLCHFLRLPACGVSVITNECFGPAVVTHSEVVAGSQQAAGKLGAGLRGLFAKWTPNPDR